MAGEQKRDYAIDILRVLGLFLVILAHCGSSGFVYELREFDVTMLVFISGMSFSYSEQKMNKSDYISYLQKRFKRLVLPVWLFLLLYFLLFGLILKQTFSIETILFSFFLINGIGFVWIFRILFSMAVINPLLKRISEKYSKRTLFIGIFAVLILNEAFIYFLIHGVSNELIRDILNYSISYTVGYGIISMMGILWRKQTEKYKILYFVAFTVLFLVWGTAILNHFPSLQLYKHPPTVYYISYGMMISIALYEICSRIKKPSAAVVWLSKETFTIYLMHIIVLNGMGYLPFIGSITAWYARWIYVMTVSIILDFLLQKAKKYLMRTA